MKILLYGGSGFLGLNLAKYFSNNENKAIIVSRSEPSFSSPNLEYVSWDSFRSEPEKILQEIDILFYLIGRSSPRQGNLAIESACQAEINDLSFLFSKISLSESHLKFIYLSSGGSVYGDLKATSFCEDDELNPITSYGKVKKAGEEHVTFCALNDNVPYLILRPSNIYGKYQSFQRRQGVIAIFTYLITRSKTIDIFGDGNSKKDYMFIDDFLIAVHKLLSVNAVGIFNIGSGHEASVNEIAAILESELKMSINKNYVDLEIPDILSLSLDCNKLNGAIGLHKNFDLKKGIKCYLKSIS